MSSKGSTGSRFKARLHPFDGSNSVFQDGVVSAAQGEPRAPRPEPFDRLKALSSIEGLGSKVSPDL
jgi:hypothetical protein